MEQLSETSTAGRFQGRLLFDSIVMFAANALGSVIGFSFHLAVARVGGTEVYADLGALLSMSIMISVAAVSVQTYVAARVARLVAAGENERPYLGRAMRKGILAGIPAGVVIALIAPWAADFLNLMQKGGVIVVGCIVVPLLILSVVRGGLQGTQRFVAFGALRIAEPVVQLAVGLGLVAAGLGAAGAISGSATAIAVSAVAGIILLKPSLKKMDIITSAGLEGGIHYMTQIVLFLAFVNCFTNVDILLVKHHFVHGEAAQYAASSFMSRILFLSAASIGFALFPKTAAGKPGEGGPLLFRSLLYFLAFAVPFIAFCSLFPRWVVGLFYGEAYVPAARILPKLLLAYGMIGVAYLIGTYRISRNRRLVWIAFCVASVLQAVIIGAWPGSPLRVAWYMILFSAVLVVIALVPFGLRKGRQTKDEKKNMIMEQVEKGGS